MNRTTNAALRDRLPREGALLLVLGIFLVGTLGATWAGASASYALQPSAVAAGGVAASSASYAIVSTSGQPAAGQAASASYSLCSGFWCQAQSVLERLFLPLIER